MLTYAIDSGGDLVSEAPGTFAAPQITGQPVDQLVSEGDFASFSVVVANTSGVTFQWAFNGNDIPGGTGDTHLLSAVAAANVGQYTVTVANSAGTVTSSPATLTLDTGTSPPSPPLRLIAYSDVGGQVTVTPFQRSYTSGTTVTLTATPSAPSVFVGWSGITTTDPTTNPLPVTVTADITVRARFAAPLPVPDNLISWWRGEPTTSTTVVDSIDANNGGFFTGSTPTAGSPSYTPNGKVGGAFQFDGTNYVQIPDAPSLQPPQFTLEAWVFPTVLSTSSYQTVIGRGSSTDNTEQWALSVSLYDGEPSFGTQNDVLVAPAAIPLNTWSHLAATFDGATQMLYVNGIQVASQGGLGSITLTPVPVGIGALWQTNTPTDLFTGCIDEVSLYDRALTLDEIFDIYNADIAGKNATAPYFTTPSPLFTVYAKGAGYSQQLTTVLGSAPITFALSGGALPPNMTLSPTGEVTGTLSSPGIFDFTVTATDTSGNATDQLYVLNVVAPAVPPPGLVSWWRGEPTTGTTVVDSIDANNGGFFTGSTPTAGSPSYTPNGKVGGAFQFDGTNYVQIPDAPSLQPLQFTLEAWVFPTVPSTSSYQTVIGRGSSTNNTEQWALSVFDGEPNFGTYNDMLVAPTAIPLNTWSHLAATFDGATKMLYVNGIQVASQGGLGPITYAPVPVGIGALWQTNIPTDLFTGCIDEVSLYDRALTPAEISAIVAAGDAGKSTVVPYITTGLQLPPATMGQPYSLTFTSVQGTAPVSYTLAAGSATPSGLTFATAGVLSGTPTTSGDFQFTVIATDAAGLSDEQTFTLQVNA